MIPSITSILLQVLLFLQGLPSNGSSMGVLVKPRPPLDLEAGVRRLFPKEASIRAFQLTHLGKDVESLIVFDRLPHQHEPDAHVVFVREGRILADFVLEQLVEYGGEYTLDELIEFRIDSDRDAVALSFRNVGDGAGTLFLVFRGSQSGYEAVFRSRASQGRIVLSREEGKSTLELWSAVQESETSPDSCTWCAHRYSIKHFEWNGRSYALKWKQLSKRILQPSKVVQHTIMQGEAR